MILIEALYKYYKLRVEGVRYTTLSFFGLPAAVFVEGLYLFFFLSIHRDIQ